MHTCVFKVRRRKSFDKLKSPSADFLRTVNVDKYTIKVLMLGANIFSTVDLASRMH